MGEKRARKCYLARATFKSINTEILVDLRSILYPIIFDCNLCFLFCPVYSALKGKGIGERSYAGVECRASFPGKVYDKRSESGHFVASAAKLLRVVCDEQTSFWRRRKNP